MASPDEPVPNPAHRVDLGRVVAGDGHVRAREVAGHVLFSRHSAAFAEEV
jgi:hypothetical protein